ncbi:MAG TPA: glucose 1-dehydrogenase [Acidimicrobiia bacterium]|nr:glucose 1-dehydrogenase [Acidimicrobiia bacterium]
MTEELAGRIAVVTGGAGGLGRGIAELAVREGAKVVIADIDADQGKELTAELGAAAAFKQTDVADADAVQDAVDFAVAEFGGLHIMVNNAGIGGSHRRFLTDDLRDFEQGMAVNLLGVMTGSQRAGRHMAEHGGGVIVNITSIGGINAGAGMVVYRAAKAAVIHFTQCIAIDLAEYGIRVNCVAPAHIPTAINTTYDQSEIVRRMQPLQRIGSPTDVAEAVVFLASDRAEQITGIVMPVDGGTTAGPPAADVRGLLTNRGDAE